MENNMGDMQSAAIFLCILGIFAAIGLVLFLAGRVREIEYVKGEILRAHDSKEREYWKRKLQALYICLIPFLSPSKVERFLKLFRKGRHLQKRQNDDVFSLFIPSFLGMGICAVCLAGSTFAWFTATSTVKPQLIQSANYSISALVSDKTNDIPLTDGKYKLEAGKEYILTITANGSASTGYCVLDLKGTSSDGEFYTQQFPSKDYSSNQIQIILDIKEDTYLQIIAQWGTYSGNGIRLSNNNTCSFGSSQNLSSESSDETE